MRELREETFFGNKNDDTHEHVERVLDIVSLFNIPGVSHDAAMLRVFPITLTGAAKRWVDNLPPRTEGDETLYQAWERYYDLLYKCPTRDINNHQEEEVKSIEEAKYDEFERLSPFSIRSKYRVGPPGYYTHMDNRPPVGEKRYDKKSPIGILENVLVKIDKFLFAADFVVMNMLNTRNETMILGRLFLATIHAEINVFNKEISLGIRGDRITFDMDKKIHNFTTPIEEIYIINATSNTPSDASSRVKETNDVHNMNNYCNQEQGRSRKKPRKLAFDINLPSMHFCKPVKQILRGELKFLPTCDPIIKECNGGHECMK
nr:hypothetical protein [Tanacetum cinerariifolium]